jgi:beta-galactosidase
MIYIEFEGVYRAAEVWINGTYLGKHLNGYIGFEYELTPYLNLEGDNVISVKYDNSLSGTSRWYTGEGIYRNVWLKTLNPVHIPLYGTYISTPKITVESAIVRVSTKVSNLSSQRKECRLVTEIVDKTGKKVAEFTSISAISVDETFLFEQNIELSKPVLWSTENPSMYKVISNVFSGNELVDKYETPIGIREIRMTPDKG